MICAPAFLSEKLGRKVLVLGGVLFPFHHLQAGFPGAFFHQVGAPRAEGVGIMQDADLGELRIFLDVLNHGGRSNGVVRPDAEQPRVAAPGKGRIRAADHHGDAKLLDGVGHGHDLGALDNAHHRQNLFLLDHFLQRGQGSRIGGLVVDNNELDLLSVYPAGFIDLFQGEFDGFELQGALRRRRTGNGRYEADFDRVGCLQVQNPKCQSRDDRERDKSEPLAHMYPFR